MLQNIPREIITHHSNGMIGNACAPTQHHTVSIIDDAHKVRWPGFTSKIYKRKDTEKLYHVGYHFVIYNDMGVWRWVQTRGIEEEGAHCLGKNTSSVGVLIVGNYDKCAGDEISPSMHERFLEVYDEINLQVFKAFGRQLEYSDIKPHRAYASKTCHGDTLSDDYYSRIVMNAQPIDHVEEIHRLKERISILEQVILHLSNFIVQLMNRSTPKRLSYREVDYKET